MNNNPYVKIAIELGLKVLHRDCVNFTKSSNDVVCRECQSAGNFDKPNWHPDDYLKNEYKEFMYVGRPSKPKVMLDDSLFEVD